MEYRGVRYELRRALGQNEWVWTVYTPEPKNGQVAGDRTYATLRAKRVIDTWCLREQAPAGPGRRQPSLVAVNRA